MADLPAKKPQTQIVKRPAGERIAEILNLDEAREWLKKAAADATRKYLYEIGVGMLQKILYRGTTKGPNVFSTFNGGSMINYNQIVSGQNNTIGVVSAQASNLNWGVPSFTYEEEAQSVLSEMIEMCQKSGYVTMYELYDLANQPSLMSVKSRKYGFRNLDISNVSIEPYNGRFIIRLPDPIKLS